MPPAVAALIRELSEKGATTVKIARVAGVSVRTVERYRNGRRPEMLNPLYDPRRDGMYEGDLTASICGDPLQAGASLSPGATAAPSTRTANSRWTASPTSSTG